MTVFKGYMKVIRQSRWLILMYVAIFFACTLLMQSAAGKTEKSFQAESLKIGIADEDGGTFALALRTYLDNFHEVIPLENDISVMQEKLFYRDVEYIVRIPENFYQKCIQGGERLPVTTVPDTYSGIYVDQQINSFLNNARTCQAAGFTEKEMADALVKDIPVKVELDTSMGSGETSQYIYYFRYVPYLALALLGFVIGNVLLVFRKKGLKNRNEIYGFRESGKFHHTKQKYNEIYHLYGEISENDSVKPDIVITEDSNSGYEFFSAVSEQKGIPCISANGTSNVINCLMKNEQIKGKCLIIADGAAFGSEMKDISEYMKASGDTVLYAPESFEWLLLSANVIPEVNVKEILEKPQDHIECREYISWERFFTGLLIQKTENNPLWRYSKKKLPEIYLSPKVFAAMKKFMKLIIWDK